MSWYRKKSSIKDDKLSEIETIIERLEYCSRMSMIDGEEGIGILKDIMARINGNKKGFRSLLKESTKNNLIYFLNLAIMTKKDSPHKYVEFLDNAISVLLDEV
jgi:hypothetical protein